jgi:hypothetical protein
MILQALVEGYRRAYRDFYSWTSILRGASSKESLAGGLRHFAYAAGWKKFEPLWGWVIRARRVWQFLPLLEGVLGGFSAGGRRGVIHEDQSEAVPAARLET